MRIPAIPTTWASEKRLYEKQFFAVLRRRTKIIDIPPEEGELGYTSSDGNIHEAYKHPIMDDLSKELQIMFRYGVFTHETLHQIFTSFSYLEQKLTTISDLTEKQVFSLFANLVEDPSIEYFAPDVFGGEMLQALNFSIRHIYRMSPQISESPTAFSQFINALVQFGDMGLLKGEFTYPEAELYFKKIAPEFNRMVTCSDPHARIDAAYKWMVMTRPLWRKESEEKEKFSDFLNELLDELMNGGMVGDGDAKNIPENGVSDERSERRAAFSKALEEEKKVESPSEENESSSSSKVSSVAGDKSNKTCAQSADSSKSPEGQERGVLKRFTETETGAEGHPAVDKSIAKLASELKEKLEKEEASDSKEPQNEYLDLPIEIPRVHGSENTAVNCMNVRMKADVKDNSYSALLSDNARSIKMLTSSIKSLLRLDYDTYSRTTSGKYSLKRDLDHTSVKVFDKRKEKKNIDDMAVMLLIDTSGSMHGEKIKLAKDTAVILAESFASLKIPCYIMGFTADTAGCDVLHNHYVTWTNNKAERKSLVKLNANANNDDGYSIRFATQILKKKKAEHKLLFVISDGAPACMRYHATDGVKDTSLAIIEAKKVSDILGIGIGIHHCKELKKMYQGRFIDVQDINELTSAVCRQLKNILRKWL